MQWRTLIHLRLWGRPLWRLLAVVALLFLAAACFLGWSIAVLNCVHLIDYGLAVALAGANRCDLSTLGWCPGLDFSCGLRARRRCASGAS